MADLSEAEKQTVALMRVAHLATSDPQGAPHLIPICFHYDGDRFYSVLDQKPKRTAVTNLKRVRNILSNPKVALVIDHWQEDWQGLWYVLVNGTADLLYEGEEHQQSHNIPTPKIPPIPHHEPRRQPHNPHHPHPHSSMGPAGRAFPSELTSGDMIIMGWDNLSCWVVFGSCGLRSVATRKYCYDGYWGST